MHEEVHLKGCLKDPASHDHTIDQFRTKHIKPLKDHATQRKRYKMSFGDLQVINDFEDVFGDDVEIVIREFRCDR